MDKEKEGINEKLLQGINDKLDVLILLMSLQGKDKKEQIKILKNCSLKLSKREIEKITRIDRHDF